MTARSPPFPSPWRAALARARADRSHGASEVAIRLLEGLRNPARARPGHVPQLPPAILRRLASELDRVQPAMGVFSAWADDLLQMSRGPATELSAGFDRWREAWTAELVGETDRVVGVAASEFAPNARVLTLSASSTVLRTLLSLQGARRPLLVRVLRSQPGGEGATLERALRSHLPTELVEDRDLEPALNGIDLVLVGADTIYRDGSLVHKVKTRSVASAAHSHAIPVVVASGLSKWVDRLGPHRRLPARFDLTSSQLMSGFWTDGGYVTRTEIARVARARRDALRASWSVSAADRSATGH